MQPDGYTNDTPARDQLSGLLTHLLHKAPGTARALLASGDGIKLAWTDESTDDADTLAATVVGLYSLGRQQFSRDPGGVRQLIVEHDAGSLFVMSTGPQFTDRRAMGAVLAVVATPQAHPGQVGHEMAQFIKGLDEHLIVQARTGKPRP